MLRGLVVAASLEAGMALGACNPQIAIGGAASDGGLPDQDGIADGGSVADGGGPGEDAATDASDDTEPLGSGYFIDDAGLDPVEAGPGQSVCGASVCNAATEVCCLTAAPGRVPTVVGGVCTPQNACSGAILACTGSESCPDHGHCCGWLETDVSPRWSQCSPVDCADASFGPSDTLCTSDAQCPASTYCKSHGVGAGYGICSPLPDSGTTDD